MKKFVFLFILLAVFSSAAAQTCDCGNLQAQVEELTVQIQFLLDQLDTVELGTFSDSPAPTQMGNTFDQVFFDGCSVNCYAKRILKDDSGMNVLEVFLIFENSSESATTNFASQIRLKAFQNNVCLLEGKMHGFAKDLRPGKKTEIRKRFILLNTETPVELEFISLRSDQDPEIRMVDLSR